MNSQDFFGHRACPLVDPAGAAWEVRPTPPQKRRNGMARFLSMTSSMYFLAFSRFMFLMAIAVSRVFLKWTRRSDPLALQDEASSWGFCAYSFTIVLGVSSPC